MIKLPEPKEVKISRFYKDPVSGIKKYSFVIRCRDCSIEHKRGHMGCVNDGCKFMKDYDGFSNAFSEYRKQEILHIMMSGYYYPRG